MKESQGQSQNVESDHTKEYYTFSQMIVDINELLILTCKRKFSVCLDWCLIGKCESV